MKLSDAVDIFLRDREDADREYDDTEDDIALAKSVTLSKVLNILSTVDDL